MVSTSPIEATPVNPSIAPRFLDKMQADISDVTRLKRSLDERTDAIRANASDALHDAERAIHDLYAKDERGYPELEADPYLCGLRAHMKTIYAHLERIANL
jgi:hypothetical protein